MRNSLPTPSSRPDQERCCEVGAEGKGERERVRDGHQVSREGFGTKEGICRVQDVLHAVAHQLLTAPAMMYTGGGVDGGIY